ncbi:MAG: hypothetical protein DRJ03_21055 [Chloroflexi bacterium]|nr:MAG: hypothetical protein B6I35_08985 [Anaerolineaceae bacterium 4572_32.2]RLC77054.1 MAG: hypothetical protein DRI81_09195 [Chloroflexota bacterium]RLC80769.1 MAG: hypothetical protein DRJ03_21055 [Chloroflexota bacterium]HEY74123.1 S8 family serine peptidase [Thermoflexia bacterium]
MTNRKPLIALLIAGVVLLVAAGVAYLLHSQSSQPSITPPPSLAELAEQYPKLAHILQDPELDSVYKEFLLAYEEGGEEAALELAGKRGMLTPQGDVAITLILDTEDNAPLVAQLEAAGVNVVSAYRDRVNVAVPVTQITDELESAHPGATFAQLTELEHVIGVELPETRAPDGSDIEGEGVAIINADDWRLAGFSGAGLRIGVLDLGFYGYQDLLGVELPDNVTMETFGWYDEEEVHGAACAEIIHEVAPEAELFFAWYDGSDAAMGEAVDWLTEQEVDIISHSAGGLVGPRDGSEWDALLVDDLAAQGILWVNSAGNEGQGHYRGTFTDEDGDNLHEFAPGDEMLPIYNWGFVKVILSWDDDWERAAQDYELYLYDANGNELAVSQDAQSGEFGNEPYEGILYETGGDTVYAVVEAYEVDEAVTLDIYVNGGDVAYPSPAHSICPPGDALGSLTVGAVNYWDDSLADYSSQGPTSDGRLKPEIAAPAGVSGSTYGHNGFDGTSASCPHTAGAAALVWQAHPEFSRQEVVDFLLTNALDLGPSGPDTGYGYGRLQLSSPPAEIPPTPPPDADTPVSPSDVTPAPLPSPTPVTFVTVTPAPASVSPPPGSGTGVSLLALTGIGLLIGGLGCAGAGLLLVGAVGLIIMGRRSRRAQPIPQQASSPAPPQLQPTRCQSCGAAIRPGARFCPACGQSAAPRACRNCGAAMKENSRFCPKCGQPV